MKRHFDLRADAEDHIIIAAHRGESAGNIPCNTLASYEIAVTHGADMIEVDVTRSREGTLWIHHPMMEPIHLGFQGSGDRKHLPELTDEEIRALRHVNYDHTPTQFGLCTFDEVLETFKGRCYINVDKFWDNPVAISDAIRKHGMQDQIVVKSAPKKELLDIVETYAPEICFLPIVNADNGFHEEMQRRNIHYVGAEVLFEKEDAELCSDAFIQKMHRDGKLVWVNAIIYDHKAQLSGGHSDDTAMTVSPDFGWGWLADRGFDIIQTDWTLAMSMYLESTGKRKRI